MKPKPSLPNVCPNSSPLPSHFQYFVGWICNIGTYAFANANNPNERLTADKAFVAISLFNILKFPLVLLPMVFSLLIQVS